MRGLKSVCLSLEGHLMIVVYQLTARLLIFLVCAARHDKAVNIANILYHTYTYRRVVETTLPGLVGGRFLANVLFSVKIRLSFCKCLIFR